MPEPLWENSEELAGIVSRTQKACPTFETFESVLSAANCLTPFVQRIIKNQKQHGNINDGIKEVMTLVAATPQPRERFMTALENVEKGTFSNRETSAVSGDHAQVIEAMLNAVPIEILETHVEQRKQRTEGR